MIHLNITSSIFMDNIFADSLELPNWSNSGSGIKKGPKVMFVVGGGDHWYWLKSRFGMF